MTSFAKLVSRRKIYEIREKGDSLDNVKLYAVKMRASSHALGQDQHISGAEKIVQAQEIEKTLTALLHRAQNHPNGQPDKINLKIENINFEDILHIHALPVSCYEVDNSKVGLDLALEFLAQIGLTNDKIIRELLPQTYGMRGAMLLDSKSYERLEPDQRRGVRVTYMDGSSKIPVADQKSHYQEALILASKVAACPQIIAELCISDDPNYVIGYVASKQFGYVRISKLKEPFERLGGRIFFFKAQDEVDKTRELNAAIDFLQKRVVLVDQNPTYLTENGKENTDIIH